METSASYSSPERLAVPPNLLAHGVVMLVVGFLIYVAQTLLWVCGFLQFIWMVVSRQRNAALVEFGQGLGAWMATASRFLTGASDLRPFPWSSWTTR